MDELVKRLRELPHLLFVQLHGHEDVVYQAADAIEELSKLADAIPHVCECCVGCELEKKNGGCNHAFVLSPKRAKEYLSKPRWIPVTEKPPLKVGDDGYNGYLVYANGYYADGKDFYDGILFAADFISQQPTIIEADEGGDMKCVYANWHDGNQPLCTHECDRCVWSEGFHFKLVEG